MTNKEKAKEINIREIPNEKFDTSIGYEDFERCLIEIAEWKDREFERKVVFALGCPECHYQSCEECPMGNIKKRLLPNE